MKNEFAILRDFWRGDFRHFRFITAVAFLLLVVVGYLCGLLINGLAESIMNWFSQLIEQAGVIKEDGRFNVIALFFNNFRAMLLGIAYGLIPFLFFPALNLGFNAMLVGLFGAVYTAGGHGLLFYLAGIVPHGIFEIPALILSIACGIYLCRSITDYVKHNEKGTVKRAIQNCMRLFLLIITPLLIIAALIECYVTPVVMNLFL